MHHPQERESDTFWRFLTDMEMISIGKVRTSHGVKGYLKIFSYSGEIEHFFKLKNIVLKHNNTEKSFVIEDIQPHGNSIILKLNGVDTPEKGKSLSNWEIWVPRENAASLAENEYYHADLCLCELYFQDEVIGRIKSVLEGGGGELFEVELTSGETVLIPFRSEFIGRISINDKLIELKNEWILG